MPLKKVGLNPGKYVIIDFEDLTYKSSIAVEALWHNNIKHVFIASGSATEKEVEKRMKVMFKKINSKQGVSNA